MTTFRPFDAAKYLDSEEAISLYLPEALDDAEPNVFVPALGDVARVHEVMQALGVKLAAAPGG